MDDLTLVEASAHLRRNRELVRQWLKSGRLGGRKRAGRWFVSYAALRSFGRNEPIRRPRRLSNAS
jgi:hypothetical protein